MKLFLVVVLALAAYASADCGCLKCSKNCAVAGEVVAAPKYCGPIKIIYRDERGPIDTIHIHKPIPNCGTGTCGYGIGGGIGRPHCRPCHFPIIVQKPVPVPPSIYKCVPLVGLKSCIDRVVLPAPHCGCGHCRNEPIEISKGPAIEALSLSDLRHNHNDGYYGHEGHNRAFCSCRYDNNNIPPFLHSRLGGCNENSQNETKNTVVGRSKRHVRLINHGYKFMMNMLPNFIQEPIKYTVNTMALTHPDDRIRKMYNIPPKLTLQDKLKLKKEESLAKLKRKVHRQPKFIKKVDDHELQKQASDFLADLDKPVHKKKYWIKSRSPSGDFEEGEEAFWLKEMKPYEIYDKDTLEIPQKKIQLSGGGERLEIPLKKHLVPKKKQGMSEEDKEVLLKKLQKVNDVGKKYKRSVVDLEDDGLGFRPKRTIILDSEKFMPPFYRIKAKSDEDLGMDEDYSEELQQKLDRNDDSEEEHSNELVSKRAPQQYDSREEILTKVIKRELKNFKRIDSREEQGSPFLYNKMIPHSPIFHLLSLPLKIFGIDTNKKRPVPLLLTIPKMIVGTKKYFTQFGRNFRKNLLHFASDIIGDFNHHGPSDHILDIVKPGRFKRSIGEKKLEPEYSLVFGNDVEQNFANASKSKPRRKRYIVKVVDEEEVAEFLKEKIGRMYNFPEPTLPKRRKYKPNRYSEEEETSEEYVSSPYRNHYNPDKYVVEKVRPKLIIDNNGLPFMEVDGYKRPLMMRNSKSRHPKKSETILRQSYSPYDTSDEVNWEQIHHLIDHTKNNKKVAPKNNEAPINTLKKKISDLLYETDMLVHLEFTKYDEIYDDMLEIQYIKNSIVQDWKRIVMENKINDYNAKLKILGKFKELQYIKDIAVKCVVKILHGECENNFVVKHMVKILIRLHKLQCVINQVVGCFEEKFRMGSKFDMQKEIKFVDFLGTLNFAKAKTRNDMIAQLKAARDLQVQQNIKLLDKLKRCLNEHEEDTIIEEANLLWEMKNVEKMQKNTIKEMYQRLGEGYKIKKNLKILIDLTKRLEDCEEDQKKIHIKHEGKKKEMDESCEDEKKSKPKKFDIEEFKKKWLEKKKKKKELLEKRRNSVKKNKRKEESGSEEND